MSKGIIGVDLGVGSIKVVSLAKDGDKIVLENIGEVKTPKFEKISDLSLVLKNLIQEKKY